ncbi:hypothetical protein QR510_27615, partial [Escherichia coli]|uniref:hypothetical protein n=1 Tax=Escherichia coli TaxID=562 RepID=UPI0027399476
TVPPGKPEPTPARQLLVDLDVDGQALLRQVTDFYHRNLLDSPEAQAWLVHRGLNHPELVSHFRLGFAGAHGISGEAGLLVTGSRRQRLRLEFQSWVERMRTPEVFRQAIRSLQL